ncbi:PAS domain S-box protein [Rhizobium sp. S163]|uniref:PAS domain S-box protein n=1 Tax=Rhizobium sp. S163 TaxID=3055039 RepID=UPI0025A9E7E7|nr:PAS domain S-box protein [Rhizobium sp. S163]MDM9645511.1 PAS domain S-box protein [Rhizobium sp. S163]
MTTREERRIDREIHSTSSGSDPFAAAMRASRMPMIITDPRQRDNPIVFVNEAFALLTGYSREETLGRNCRFLQGPGTNTQDVDIIRKAIEERSPIEIDLLNYKKDGSVFWNRLLVSPVFDEGELTYFFASQYDVTREKTGSSRLEQQDLGAALERRIADLTASEERLHFTLKAGGLGVWTLDVPVRRLVCSPICKANFGREPAESFTYDDLQASIHPDDVDRWREAVDIALQSDGNLHVEYRIVKPDGELAWVEIRAETRFDEAGQPLQMSGVSIDATERRHAEAHKAMMAQEMGHRMKNMLAITQSIVNQSLRADQSPASIRSTIAERLGALSRSADVLHGREFDTLGLREIVEQAVAPFNGRDQIQFSGPEVTVSHQANTSLSLGLHELATNATKYGALSTSVGRVEINWTTVGDRFELHWKEAGGPLVSEPSRSGFGTKLIQMVGVRLHGKAEIQFDPEGLRFSVVASTGRLAAQSV